MGTPKTKSNYQLPKHLEPYRSSIVNTGGNTVEDLMNRLENQPNLAFSNIIVFTMASSVSDQIALLEKLHKQGHLALSL